MPRLVTRPAPPSQVAPRILLEITHTGFAICFVHDQCESLGTGPARGDLG
jgi:hypothetical protein